MIHPIEKLTGYDFVRRTPHGHRPGMVKAYDVKEAEFVRREDVETVLELIDMEHQEEIRGIYTALKVSSLPPVPEPKKSNGLLGVVFGFLVGTLTWRR